MRNHTRHKPVHSLEDGVPALDALWSYRRRPVTDLNLVKAARAATVWRSATLSDRMQIARHYLRWLYWFPPKVVKAVMSNGKDARQRYGRSFLGQVKDMLRIAFVNGTPPLGYYLAALARHNGGDEILRYPPFALIRAAVRHFTAGEDRAKLSFLNDKTAFERRCRAAGLPVVRTIAIVQETDIRTPEGTAFEGPLPDRDMIIKPERGQEGRSTESWRSVGPGEFSDAAGNVLQSADLLNRAGSITKARGNAVLIQERLQNHPDLRPISGSALSTTRIVTMLNETGKPEVVDTFYRTSTEPGAAVDNFHNGGALFPIDVATGTFLAGMKDAAFDKQSISVHPETGTPMAGHVHPRWQEVTELALRLHTVYGECLMAGWDIAVGPDGAVAVELNIPPGISMNRQPTFGGLVGTRTLSLLAFHANEWLQRNEPPTSRWRVGIDLQSAGSSASGSVPQSASATSRSPSSSVASPEKNRRSHNSRPTIR